MAALTATTTRAAPWRAAGDWLVKYSPVALVAVFWEIVTRTRVINPDILPAFSTVLVALWDLVGSGEILPHLAATLFRGFAGLALGAAFGVLLGIWMARSSRAQAFFDPLVTLTYPLPKTAFIPVALLWLGVGHLSAILLAFLGTMVPLIINAYHGAKAVRPHLIWSAQAMGASPARILRDVIIPASLPYIFNGARIGLAFSVVIVISAEMVAARQGVGKFIFMYGESGNYNYMFAAILTVIVVAFLIDRGFVALSRRLLRWAESAEAAQ